MNLKKCYLKNNRCFQKNQKMAGGKPTGIVVHSTGANNPTIKRYVAPLKTDEDYKTIVADIGENRYGNSWNRSNVSVCVHAFVGKNAAGQVETYQTLPFDVCCWGCGSGAKGSYNYNPRARVQFEICEDGLTDAGYFNKAMREAQELCAYLCTQYNIPVSSISSHKEASAAGYASRHGDPEHWMAKHGKNMAWFRAEVQKLLAEPMPTPTPAPTIKVGSHVKLRQGAKTYTGGNLASYVYPRVHDVKSLRDDRVVISYRGVTVAAVNIRDLILA